MLHSPSGARIHAAQSVGNPALHKLNSRLELHFDAPHGVTRLRTVVQEPPWRVVRGFPMSGGGSLVHLHNVSGGILAGDRLYLSAVTGSGAAAQITSTGATRLYRHKAGARDSEQQIEFHIAPHGLLEYLPDPVIPFKGSRHHQVMTVTLANHATFFGWDVLAPGRQAMGEEFAFESLRVETRFQSAHRLIMLEKFLLEPHLRPLHSSARLGKYKHCATFYAMQQGHPPASLRELEAVLGQAAREASGPDTIWGASALASDGVVVRGLSMSARHLPAALIRFWTAARRFLTGAEAVPPRKVH